MYKKNNSGLSVFLFLGTIAFFVMLLISSCGKSGVAGKSTLNIQYQIINLSPDLGSVDLYINYKKVNSYSYFYPSSSGYFYLNAIDTPFQIRPGTTLTPGTVAPSFNIISLDNALKPNLKYTLMITGLKTDTLAWIFTTDTSSLPALGRGKIRFINASPHSTGFDVTANGTPVTAFSGVKYLKDSKYIEIPAGTYDFQLFSTGSTTILKDVPNISIQDGRLYTLYSYGLAGHTDSLAFGTGVIVNK